MLGNQEPARLVIHKMVLKHFKSYGGTVEIGPFHTVIIYFIMFSLLLQLLVQMEVGSQMLLMHCYLYLDLKQKK